MHAVVESKMPATPSEIGSETELVYKIMVVGNAGCGKTSIINRFVNNIFSETYKSTVGADFSRKVHEAIGKFATGSWGNCNLAPMFRLSNGTSTPPCDCNFGILPAR